MPQQCDVLCVGETMIMVTPVGGGPLRSEADYHLHPGGAESNVATHLAGLGHRAAWASYIGEDALGDLILDRLSSAGVDVSLVKKIADAPTGVYFKDPRPSGTRVLYYRSGSAASTMQPDVISELQALTPRVIHLSGITPALSPGCRALIDRLVLDRIHGNALVSFDVNYRAALWGTQDAATELLRVAQASDIVFVGRDEAEMLWGASTAESIRELLDRPSSLVVKDSSKDATSFTSDGYARVAALEVEVVEPVGAGDAFAAGWLSGMLRGMDQDRRLQFGHLLASRVLGSTADSAPPQPVEVVLHALQSSTPSTLQRDRA